MWLVDQHQLKDPPPTNNIAKQQPPPPVIWKGGGGGDKEPPVRNENYVSDTDEEAEVEKVEERNPNDTTHVSDTDDENMDIPQPPPQPSPSPPLAPPTTSTPAKRYICQLCKQGFYSPTALNFHLESHHTSTVKKRKYGELLQSPSSPSPPPPLLPPKRPRLSVQTINDKEIPAITKITRMGNQNLRIKPQYLPNEQQQQNQRGKKRKKDEKQEDIEYRPRPKRLRQFDNKSWFRGFSGN